jgi:hypothetical protein
VNQREAKRRAATLLAAVARTRAEAHRARIGSGRESKRMARAYGELAEELERRADGKRTKRAVSAIDPNQLSILDEVTS